MTMKLQNEYEYAKQMAVNKITDEELYNYTLQLKHHRYVHHLDVKVIHELRYVTMPLATVCEWYDKYDCNDEHITELYKRIIKENYPMTWEAIVSI